MIPKLKCFWGMLLVCVFFTGIAFGETSSEFQYLEKILDQDVPLEDKLEYLDSLKNKSEISLSNKEIEIIEDIFGNRLKGYESDDDWDDEEDYEFDDDWKDEEDDEFEIEGIDEILVLICEILLKADMDKANQSEIEMLGIAVSGMKVSDVRYEPLDLFFLRLKVLIKLNMLKVNGESEEMFSIISNFIMSSEYESDEDIQKSLDEVENRATREWFIREEVEEDIFQPVLVGTNFMDEEELKEKIKDRMSMTGLVTMEEAIFKEIGPQRLTDEYKTGLDEYENYLSEQVQYFQVNNSLKDLIEQAFFKTKNEKVKLNYIEAMFCLDMRDTLIKIINNRSIDSKVRKQAIDTSVKLLGQVDILHFKLFSMTLLRSLNIISSNSTESKELREIAQATIDIVQQHISKRDDIKDLEKIIFNKYISTEEKIQYLYQIEYLGVSLSKKDLDFVRRVLNTQDFDMDIKSEIAFMALYGLDTSDLLEGLSQDDVDSLVFLYHRINYLSKVDSVLNFERDVHTAKDFMSLYFKLNPALPNNHPYNAPNNAVAIDHSVGYFWDSISISSSGNWYNFDVGFDLKIEEKFQAIASFLETNMNYTITEQKLRQVRPLIKIIERVQHIRSTKAGLINATYTDKDLLKQYSRFDFIENILNIIKDSKKDDSIRRSAIKVSLDLLARTKNFDEVSNNFLEILKEISKNSKESHELKDIADFIILKVKTYGINNVLKVGDCSFKLGI